MPKFSAFTRLGHLRLSKAPTDAEKIYRSIARSYGDQVSMDRGSRFDATAYATAMGVARARLTLKHAWKQRLAATASEHLASEEREHGIVPGRNDTLEERRAVLAARKKVPQGASRAAVEMALRELLGDDYIYYYTTKPAGLGASPANLGDQPMNLQLPSVQRKLGRLLQPIATTGVSFVVGYEVSAQAPTVTASGVAPTELAVGDVVVVGAGRNGIEERVTVTSTFRTDETTTYPRFAATFTKPHSAGEFVTTMPFPMWLSNQRHNVIVVTTAVAENLERRRTINELLRRMLRAESTWDIVDVTSATTAGPFKIGEGKLGITPLGTVTFP